MYCEAVIDMNSDTVSREFREQTVLKISRRKLFWWQKKMLAVEVGENYVAMQLHGRSRQQRASGTAREVASWVWNSWGGVNIIATGDKT